jgi:hypothetical protein
MIGGAKPVDIWMVERKRAPGLYAATNRNCKYRWLRARDLNQHGLHMVSKFPGRELHAFGGAEKPACNSVQGSTESVAFLAFPAVWFCNLPNPRMPESPNPTLSANNYHQG